jgi:hypothetical protein
MKIKIAFYKGEGELVNRLVRWWTKSPYSHAELILPDDVTWVGISPFLKSEVSARRKEITNLSDWDFIEFEITSQQNDIIMQFYEETKGNKYDWFGMMASQFIPFVVKQKGRWYCSEWIAYALRIAGVFDWKIIKIYDQHDLSPGTLYRIATEVKAYININDGNDGEERNYLYC